MEASNNNNVTKLLGDLSRGKDGALQLLTPIIIDELHRLARHYMQNESPNHTLQATALVNEAYMKLIKMDVSWSDRVHFFAVAATQMRRILVDHARSKLTTKRGGEFQRVTLDEGYSYSTENNSELIYIDELLTKLSQFDEKSARMFELRLFAGLSNEEIAEVEKVSISTIERELRTAKAWLLNELI